MHTQIIFTSCALLPSVDISWLPCKLKAHMPTVIRLLECICRYKRVAAKTLKRAHIHENSLLKETHAMSYPKLLILHLHTNTKACTHVMPFRLKMKNAKLKGSAWVSPLSTNLFLPFPVCVSPFPHSQSILTIIVTTLRWWCEIWIKIRWVLIRWHSITAL